jgi:hypothetical protein
MIYRIRKIAFTGAVVVMYPAFLAKNFPAYVKQIIKTARN